ncbi:MAG: IPTL-CTERM sorting domain-containing protein, partial [Wenzhouxiangella sp.]|nr:IPTL-CTERM sorting domain-containing protein [Wenzhouxiangella sp.]
LETTESVSPGNHTLLIATDDLLVSLGIELVDDTSNAAVPVPTLALTALMVLSVLLGLMGLAQVRTRQMRFNTTS